MPIFVVVLFWVATAFSFFVLSPKTALTSVAAWGLGLAAAVGFHLQPLFFVAYQALLALILCIMLQREWTS